MGAALKVEAQRIAKPEASARANVMWNAEAATDLFCFFFMDRGVAADSTGSLVVLVLFWGVFRRISGSHSAFT